MILSETHVESKSCFHQCGGAEILMSKVVFTRDSKFICCCCGCLVKVISVTSGECVRELHGHKDDILCVQTNPNNVLQVFTSSRDNSVNQWDYQDGVILKTFDTKVPLSHFVPLPGSAISFIAKTENSIVKLKLFKNQLLPETIFDKISPSCKSLSVGCNNDLVASYDTRHLFCHSLSGKLTRKHPMRSSEKHGYTTCIQCHPSKTSLVTGNSSGKIYFWWNVLDDEVVMTLYHWHHLSVNDLEYVADGSYVLSGGHECVLVKWQNGTDSKDFLPRLEAPINHISCSPDNSLYCLVHADNAIKIVSSSFELVQQYQGLTRAYLPHQLNDLFPTGLLSDPKTGSLVLSGRPGYLQFYNVSHDRQLYNMDITGENYVVVDESKGLLSCTEVTRAAFDRHGDVLATVEVWTDGSSSTEIRLKFWHDTDGSGSFTLNTCVELPHNKPINALVFRPSKTSILTAAIPSAMLVTTSDDGKFKLWRLVDDTDIHRINIKWDCESVGFYRDLPAKGAAFSEDGSVLAVVFGSGITLWNPDSNALKMTLPSDEIDGIRNIAFGRYGCSHLLLSTSSSRLTVWNLLSCSIEWSVSVNVHLLASDPSSDQVAVVTTDDTVIVFHLDKPDVRSTYKGIGDIVGAIFILSNDVNRPRGDVARDESTLYVITRSQKLFRLANESRELSKAQHASVPAADTTVQPMSLILTAERRTAVGERSVMEDVPSTARMASKPTELFANASHVLAPASQLCGYFLRNLLDCNIGSNKAIGHEDELDASTSSSVVRDSDSDTDAAIAPRRAVQTIVDSTEPCDGVSRAATEELQSLEQVVTGNYEWSCVFKE